MARSEATRTDSTCLLASLEAQSSGVWGCKVWSTKFKSRGCKVWSTNFKSRGCNVWKPTEGFRTPIAGQLLQWLLVATGYSSFTLSATLRSRTRFESLEGFEADPQKCGLELIPLSGRSSVKRLYRTSEVQTSTLIF